MGPMPRFEVHFRQHIGVGVWWDNDCYTLELYLALPFMMLAFGIGSNKQEQRSVRNE